MPHTPSSTLRTQPPTEIVARLYVGDLAAAEDPQVLTALRITHVLSAMPGHVALPPSSSLPHLGPHQSLQRFQLPVHDTPFSELAAFLPRATAWIAAALSDPGARVLVHCAQGVSRSASVAAAFLVAYCNCTPEQAVQHVQARRPCAQPNPGFVSQLAEFYQTVHAGMGAGSGGGGRGHSGRNTPAR
ncbi:phosphatases II [Trametes coccinea BRFM310]|uniref:protein-tyrosine-phosphatase n=1 Tax=Trametes coccinea (strain BRFM310) TaxID=1353009 RepID=A0A1Y2J845_TRAC3|nr:phosphatases II [Trametes coccinea BRFM310]